MRGLPLLLLATLSTTAVADQRPVGKIVRIERSARPKTIPIFCMGDARSGTPDKGRCLGLTRPSAGDVVQFVDETHLAVELKVGSVEPIPDCDVGYLVQFTGDVDVLETNSLGGLIGASIEARGKRVEVERGTVPDAGPDEQPILAVDRDGSGSLDIAVTFSQCDGNGTAVKSYDDYCIYTYAVDDGKWKKTSTLPGLMKCMRSF